MDPIQESIYKYEKMYEYVRSKNPRDFIDKPLMRKELGFSWDGGESCPLCKSYFDMSACQNFDMKNKDDPCRNCPIYKKIGFGGCLDTPWEDLNDSPTWGMAIVEIKREIEFLKSLAEAEE